MTQDIAALAASLSEAQRWALLNGSLGTISPATRPATRCWFQRNGIVYDRQYSESLTPLGIAVRAHLQEPRS